MLEKEAAGFWTIRGLKFVLFGRVDGADESDSASQTEEMSFFSLCQ